MRCKIAKESTQRIKLYALHCHELQDGACFGTFAPLKVSSGRGH
jgi:hypothetical protein